ncbi:flavocytochrome c [uncultured Shewanella sp.]|uniref:flavocytochrome c n=1 Tax=Shewanella atlantica TaxID=271099 RepID=UPI0026383023|nr:flavocytochrome c [uncultured Shewanella sp.]
MSNKLLDRRHFIKGLGAAGVAMTTPALASSINSDGIKWDETIEIAIIGSGFAGLAAAIEATRQGCKSVTVFEKMPVFGGNSTINGGLTAIPDSPLQKEMGIKDSIEAMVADQIKSGRGVADVELLRHVATHANEALQLTLDAGVEFKPKLEHLGGHSVPRSYQTKVNCGAGVIRPLTNECRKIGVKLKNRCKFESFIINDEGGIEGVKLRKNHYFAENIAGDEVFIRVSRGVIMACGGFAQNIELRMAQDPTLTDEVGCTNHKGATGEGMLEMFRHGAIPVHMAHIQSGPWASPDEGSIGVVPVYAVLNFPTSIAIDKLTGRRFMNELADRKTRADAELLRRDKQGNPLPGILLTGKANAKKKSKLHMDKVLQNKVGWEFDTLDALAEHFNIPLQPLKLQVEEWNNYVRNNKDKQFGKPMGLVNGQTIEAPYLAVNLWPKVHYCQGGVKINHDAQVIDSLTNKPISGLYAAGEVVGGLHGVSRLGSTSSTECLVMGMTAARSAMKA